MVRLDHDSVAERYSPEARESIAQALDILDRQGFFGFLVEQNNRHLVESYSDDSAEELTKQILDNRHTNKILLSLPELILIVKEQTNA